MFLFTLLSLSSSCAVKGTISRECLCMHSRATSVSILCRWILCVCMERVPILLYSIRFACIRQHVVTLARVHNKRYGAICGSFYLCHAQITVMNMRLRMSIACTMRAILFRVRWRFGSRSRGDQSCNKVDHDVACNNFERVFCCGFSVYCLSLWVF